MRSVLERFRPQTVVMSQNEIYPKAQHSAVLPYLYVCTIQPLKHAYISKNSERTHGEIIDFVHQVMNNPKKYKDVFANCSQKEIEKLQNELKEDATEMGRARYRTGPYQIHLKLIMS
ncbi:hypothetical protein SAMN05216420_10157 [Nitrosospira sp. Nl5]|nr:hypothetical protein SAMN05216420_10157 [Nitrosospira sp. Nl5]